MLHLVSVSVFLYNDMVKLKGSYYATSSESSKMSDLLKNTNRLPSSGNRSHFQPLTLSLLLVVTEFDCYRFSNKQLEAKHYEHL